jgi:hypothetical protein
MKLYKVGEKSKAVCPFCKGLQATTFCERDVPLESGKGTVKQVLVATCDSCDKVISVPHQSAPRIKDAIAKVRKPMSARIPRHLSDVLVLSSSFFGRPGNDEIQLILFRYFLLRIASRKGLSAKIAELASSEEAEGRGSARLDIQLNSEQFESLEGLKKRTHLKDSEVARGVIVQMKHDILDHPKPAVVDALKQVVALVG